jgi:hypothetical protein
LSGIQEKTAVVRAGLEALIARQSAYRLAALGGTERDLRPIPRLMGHYGFFAAASVSKSPAAAHLCTSISKSCQGGELHRTASTRRGVRIL